MKTWIMLQRLERAAADEQRSGYHYFVNTGGLCLIQEEIEALLPKKVSLLSATKELEVVSVTEIHMKSGKTHLVPWSIGELLTELGID